VPAGEPPEGLEPADPEPAPTEPAPAEPPRLTRHRFEELVSDALDRIPAPLTRAMDNVVVVVADRHPDEPDLLGLYEGIALTERGSDYSFVLPDRITLYQDAIEAVCADEDEVVHEVLVTVVHEVAHHFGLDDEALHELGWG
jgi:predicted Zn-dependent protease with MMP-like domain